MALKPALGVPLVFSEWGKKQAVGQFIQFTQIDLQAVSVWQLFEKSDHHTLKSKFLWMWLWITWIFLLYKALQPPWAITPHAAALYSLVRWPTDDRNINSSSTLLCMFRKHICKFRKHLRKYDWKHLWNFRKQFCKFRKIFVHSSLPSFLLSNVPSPLYSTIVFLLLILAFFVHPSIFSFFLCIHPSLSPSTHHSFFFPLCLCTSPNSFSSFILYLILSSLLPSYLFFLPPNPSFLWYSSTFIISYLCPYSPLLFLPLPSPLSPFLYLSLHSFRHLSIHSLLCSFLHSFLILLLPSSLYPPLSRVVLPNVFSRIYINVFWTCINVFWNCIHVSIVFA